MVLGVSTESLADRVWFALHCLGRDHYGRPPAPTTIERQHRLGRGLIAKLYRERQRALEDDTLSRLATALEVSPEWLKSGIGEPPKLTGNLPPRPTAVSPPSSEVEGTSPRSARSIALLMAESMGLDPVAIAAVRDAPAREYTSQEWLAKIVLEAADRRLARVTTSHTIAPASPLPPTARSSG
jgi:hypothetical protein